MNATAKNQVDPTLGETAFYQERDFSDTASGSEQPTGNPAMPDFNPTSRTHGRYSLGSGARPLDGYTIKRAIGRGGFGEVYYATSDSGKEVALKLILRNLDVERRGVVQCMNLKHPNLLTIFDLKTNDDGDAFVVMEYVAGPSLANVLRDNPKGLPPAEVRHWMKGLVEGVAYLHDHGVVHRDLKPANLFMEEGVVKIGDYGLAKLITASHGSEHSESIGTCHYMAPEIGSGKYHKPIDVYAIGVILYEMLTGRVPFDGESVNEVLMKHLTARPDVSAVPEPYRGIVARALAKDPNHRQVRVHEMLTPEDAPRAPDVRFIGDGRKGAAGDDRPNQPPRPGPADDVHRIEAEEPIFYIGPDTRPPGSKPTIQDRLRANWRAMRSPQDYPKLGGAAARRARRYVRPAVLDRAAYASAPVAPPPAEPAPQPPEPPVQPSPRARVAELTASMLWSAVVLALLAVPAAAALRVDIDRDPQQIAYLYGMGLLGTWTALGMNKFLEHRRVDSTSRRLVALAGGAALGGVSLPLAQGLHIQDQSMNFGAIEWVYFGLLFAALTGWRGLSDRDRRRRFRLVPVAWTALVAGALTPFWPYQQPVGVVVAALIATTLQIVSPWSEQAARHALYVRNLDKSKRKTNVA